MVSIGMSKKKVSCVEAVLSDGSLIESRTHWWPPGGFGGVDRDDEGAVFHYLQAAAHGNIQANMALGYRHIHGCAKFPFELSVLEFVCLSLRQTSLFVSRSCSFPHDWMVSSPNPKPITLWKP